VAAVAEHYCMKIDPAVKIQQLTVGEQQRVEILSSLYRGAEVLILDEPTAVLTPHEAEILADGLRKMVAQGKAIVFISHKLEEVLKLTQRVTVLRAGRVVFSAMSADTTKSSLAREMIGHDLASLHGEQKASFLALAGAEQVTLLEAQQAEPAASVILDVDSLHVLDDRGLPAVRGVSLAIHAGEILGIAGVDGNGQRELVEAIARLRPIQSGRLMINDQEATHWQTKDFIKQKACYVTDDRQHEGLILDFDLGRNAALKIFDRPPFSRRGLLDYAAIYSFTSELMEAFDVRAPSPAVQAGTLSGGNQQKLVLARELSQSPRLILVNKPTRGLDIGAATYINQKLLDERAKGNGILLISADLDELLLLSDRILVMFNGSSMGELQAGKTDIHKIGMMMAGTPLAELEAQEVAP
jgi:simple sugar transport system ATP-binding protein